MVSNVIMVILLAGLKVSLFMLSPKLSGLVPARIAVEGEFLPRTFLRPATI